MFTKIGAVNKPRPGESDSDPCAQRLGISFGSVICSPLIMRAGNSRNTGYHSATTAAIGTDEVRTQVANLQGPS